MSSFNGATNDSSDSADERKSRSVLQRLEIQPIEERPIAFR